MISPLYGEAVQSNESFNVLKTKGYNLEHNFGHGKQHLATVLAILNLLAFACHTVCELGDRAWRAARRELVTRQGLSRIYGPSQPTSCSSPGMSCSGHWLLPGRHRLDHERFEKKMSSDRGGPRQVKMRTAVAAPPLVAPNV